MTSGSNTAIFKLDDGIKLGEHPIYKAVEAVWSGTDGTNVRILTYSIEKGLNGRVLIDEARLKAALLAAGITDGAGNALSIPDDIADI